MPLYITSLNSGSNGNCYYIGNEREAVLVDAGLSCRETENRLARLGLTMHRVKAIFISHEHTDHTKGVEMIARKYRLPVYITNATIDNSKLRLDPELVRHFAPHSPVTIGNLTVKPFPKRHDASEPHSFTISGDSVTVGVFTDIGSPCEHVVHYFRQCHAAFLEANYDEIMLEEGNYPVHLKKRIKGNDGHLSNRQALDIFLAYKSPSMSHLLLSHLSENNNHPDLVLELFSRYAGGIHVAVASRYNETAVYCISG
jgi:phosphoribosyl 1,2-cyclic phosphodiesterase